MEGKDAFLFFPVILNFTEPNTEFFSYNRLNKIT